MLTKSWWPLIFMQALKTTEKYIPYALPFLLFFFRGLADLTVLLLGLMFLFKSYKESNWYWLQETWMKCALFFVLYLSTINVAVSINPSDTFFYAITFIRWPIFAAAVCFWLFNSDDAIKKFLISLSILLAFIIFDVWFQYLSGADIFGYPTKGIRLTGPLRDNPVIGIFITKYIYLGLISIFIFKRLNHNYSKYLFALSLLVIGFVSVFITGERMSLILYTSAVPIILLGFGKNVVKKISLVTVFLSLLVVLALIIGEIYPHTMERAFHSTVEKLSNFMESDYGLVYRTAYQTWLYAPWLGGGLHQLTDLYFLYGINLWEIKILHAHNHPLSLLAETGLVGLCLYFLIIFNIVKKIIFEVCSQKNWVKLSILLGLIYLCFWPLMSHFSFQHNWMNATNWFVVGVVLALSKRRHIR